MATTADGRIYLEVHPDVFGMHLAPYATVQAMAVKYHLTNLIDWRKAERVIREKQALPKTLRSPSPCG